MPSSRTSANLSKFRRSSGILLHPSSLPGKYGIGELGQQALQWIDFLKQSKCGLWQILPLGPTGYGDSPYQCFSSFAGNPNLISLEALYQENLLDAADLDELPEFSPQRVDFGVLIPWKTNRLWRAYQNFRRRHLPELQEEFERFCHHHADWLEDFALFMALKQVHQGRAWMEWDEPFRQRSATALKTFLTQHQALVDSYRFQQFLFYRQWSAVRKAANQAAIQIIGDVPIFVAQDSCDVWCNPRLFKLKANGYPRQIAGVPPDYFSPTGQRWGNPTYNWRVHQETNFDWWKKRIKHTLAQVDLIRIDHFRGFSACWEIPAHLTTAEKGRWVKAPGKSLFSQLVADLGEELPFIAEDLGVITADVVELRERFRLPGMKILQFAFGTNGEKKFLPHNFVRNCVVYTGSHDNDTTLGWWNSIQNDETDTKNFFMDYTGSTGNDICKDMIRLAYSSIADLVIIPLQDFLRLGSEARMNFPGKPNGNWAWRFKWSQINDELCEEIKRLVEIFER